VLSLIQKKLLLRIMQQQPDLLTQAEKEDIVNSIAIMDFKGCGGFHVGTGQKTRAIELIKQHVGEFEFEYFSDSFVSETELPSDYYGKFEIENLSDLFFLFFKENVIVIDFFCSKD